MTRLQSEDAPSSIRRPVAPWLVGLVTAIAFGLPILRTLSNQGWDPTLFIGFGAEATPTLEYAEERLGEVWARARQGHDGKFFFVQANDPLCLDPGTHAARLDHPVYRSQRMLYPLLAGGLGLFTPYAIAWGMLVVNILAVGIGTWGVAHYARIQGWSGWWGLAFGLNPGVVFEILIGGSGALAFAAAVWALVAVERDRPAWAAAGFTAAVLSREVMLIMVAGAAFWWWRRTRKIRWLWLVTPPAVFGAWLLYLTVRLGGLAPDSPDLNAFGVPFVGLGEAARGWPARSMDLIVGWLVVAILVLFVFRALPSDRLIAWATLGFVPLAFLLSERVWYSYFDITRAVAPLLTAWVLVAFANTTPRRGLPHEVRPRTGSGFTGNPPG